MADDNRSIDVRDGKYTFKKASDGWRIQVLRYGDPWLVIEAGHNAITALMDRAELADDLLAAMRMHSPFPIWDILEILAESEQHLRTHGCDCVGYERRLIAADGARAMAKAIKGVIVNGTD